MVEEYLDLIAVTLLAVAASAVFHTALSNASTPAVCKAAEIALANPGTELVVHGRFKVFSDGQYVYLSCGLSVPREKVLAIEKTEGRLRVGTTAEGLVYIK
jgi:hypothetical protein